MGHCHIAFSIVDWFVSITSDVLMFEARLWAAKS